MGLLEGLSRVVARGHLREVLQEADPGGSSSAARSTVRSDALSAGCNLWRNTGASRAPRRACQDAIFAGPEPVARGPQHIGSVSRSLSVNGRTAGGPQARATGGGRARAGCGRLARGARAARAAPDRRERVRVARMARMTRVARMTRLARVARGGQGGPAALDARHEREERCGVPVTSSSR